MISTRFPANMLNLFKKFFFPPTLAISSAGLSDAGQVRKKNEDCFTILEGKNIFIVADGMGGHNGGEVASQATIEIMRRHFSNKTINAMGCNSQEIRHAMLSGFAKANSTVMALAREETALQGMGCTLVMAFINGTTLHTCHVGDARCYVISGDQINQITTDHTAAEESGEILHNRHIVTRVIGYPFPEPPEYNTTSLHDDDKILLCSDGLWSMLDNRTIYQSITEAESPEKAAKSLITLANKAGGDDNITALTIFC
ncbi:MAG: protein phosphatase 2C domain-containing protein [Thermodesulfobacteriota bacterium]